MLHTEAYQFIIKNLKPRKIEVDKASNDGYDPNVVASPCDTFEHLLDNYGETLHLTAGMIDTLSVMLAVNLSLKLGDVPIWAYIIGPPSSGKTTLADCVAAAHPYCYSVSKITGVFSGFRGPGGDASLLPKFQDRTVIMKDFTSILKLPPGTQDTIFGELRELYDGSANVHYRNRINRTYNNIRFAMLACVTDTIRAYNHTELGERFLCVEIDSWWTPDGFMGRYESGSGDHIDRAMDNMLGAICDVDASTSGKLIPQKNHTFGLLESLHKMVESDPQYVSTVADNVRGNAEFKRLIANLSQWVSLARANVERDRHQGLLYRPRAELGLRLAKQLIKLAISLCLVFRIYEPDERVDRIIRKVALDTAISFQLEIMLALAHCTDPNGLTNSMISQVLNISPTSVARHLADMRELNIIKAHTVSSSRGAGGRPTSYFKLTDETDALAKALKFK